ncbi:MAG: 1-acylglycerol-3-phosphate O-acyltransferase [Bacteriovoracaceae bacterium]|jgi:1-acyl-sn-glycerol-3-phosphate acyltransferase|nr:1-acylglycerol-3-phosphate O-acyltransferase [Bacteriovoracaceae bacterium]
MLQKIRYLFFFLYLIFNTGLVGLIICIFRPFHADNSWLTCQFMGQPMKLIMGLKYIIRGKEIIDPSRPCVFISNHQNNIDLIAGSLALPHRTVSLGKTSILYIPVFGLFYWLSGNILINRTNKRKAKESMEKVTYAIKNKNISVWVMPEGTRSRGRGLMPFKNGAFRTAIDAEVPIVPICFNTYSKTANYNKLHSGTIACQVLNPIQTTGLVKSDAAKLAKKCHALMSEALEKLDQEFPRA